MSKSTYCRAGGFVLLGALLSCSSAFGRGFCNVDHVGNAVNRQAVQHASAKFYDGLAHVATMLQAYELSNDGENGLAEFRRNAKAAAGLFNESAEEYHKVEKQYRHVPNWPRVEEASVNALLRSAGGAQLKSVITRSNNDGPAALLSGCASRASQMATITERFPGTISSGPRTLPFSKLLGQLSKSLQFGVVVSAVFAYVGGERSE